MHVNTFCRVRVYRVVISLAASHALEAELSRQPDTSGKVVAQGLRELGRSAWFPKAEQVFAKKRCTFLVVHIES